MSLIPSEYQIPTGDYSTVPSQPTENISDEINSIYDQTNVIDYSFYREQKIELKNSVHSERVSEINNNVLKLRQQYLDSNFFTTSQGSAIRALAKRLVNINTIHKLHPLTEEDLIKKESREVGVGIFGELLPNEHREFFMDHEGHWFFYKEITNSSGALQSVTLHYEILPTGILCINSESGIKGEFLEGEHLNNFMIATETYHALVQNNIYKHTHTGKKAA